MNIQKIDINLLKPAEYNPRKKLKKSDKEYIKIKNSIEKFGYIDPIILNKDFTVIGGHQRLTVLKDLKYKEIDCVVVDISKEEEKALNIGLNKISGEWDKDLLKDLFLDLKLTDIDLNLTGFDDIEISELIGEELKAEEDDFEVPNENEIKTDIVLGDLFEIGEHRLLCGDSTNPDSVAKLMNGEKADMVFTDPPFPNNSEIMHEMIKNIDSAFNNSRIFCDDLMIWFWDNLEFPPFLEQVTSKHIWHKTNGWQAGHFETMYCYHNDSKRHEQKVYSINNVGGENNREEQGNHPTPKPISLVFNIVNDLSKNSKLILDLFLGSGTTMVASHQLKRKCYGMELDPKYCQVIIDRMRKLDPTLVIKKNGVII